MIEGTLLIFGALAALVLILAILDHLRRKLADISNPAISSLQKKENLKSHSAPAGRPSAKGFLTQLEHSIFSVVDAVLLRFSPRRRSKIAAIEKLRDLVSKHERTLITKRNQLIEVDDYGNADSSKWNAEVQYFFDKVVLPELSDDEAQSLVGELSDIANVEVEARIRKASAALREKIKFQPSMTGLEYEHFVGQLLEQLGWDAKVSKASGDQGADVIAQRNGTKLVVQCKMYSLPVGNKAVQEAIAAKQHYLADEAWVVTNSTYTKSARQLAMSSGVKLLHHDNLEA